MLVHLFIWHMESSGFYPYHGKEKKNKAEVRVRLEKRREEEGDSKRKQEGRSGRWGI